MLLSVSENAKLYALDSASLTWVSLLKVPDLTVHLRQKNCSGTKPPGCLDNYSKQYWEPGTCQLSQHWQNNPSALHQMLFRNGSDATPLDVHSVNNSVSTADEHELLVNTMLIISRQLGTNINQNETAHCFSKPRVNVTVVLILNRNNTACCSLAEYDREA